MAGSDREQDRGEHLARDQRDERHIDPEPLDPEEPAAGVDDVIEFFDREPPERPVTDADAPPPFG